jgi:sodium/proline symporter
VGGVTLAYTLFGGFLGATWTDVAQGLLMLAALLAVPIIAVIKMGGIGAVVGRLDQVDESLNAAAAQTGGPLVDHLSLFGDTSAGLTGATVLAIISAVAWGLGYFGQPHIIVRFMALRSAKEAKAGRRYGIAWMTLSAAGAVAAGIIGVAYYADAPLANRETVFLALAQALFHPLVAGFVLAAVMAAIMSTISSQLVVSSSALVVDILETVGLKKLTDRGGVLAGRLAVLLVAVVGAILGLTAADTILDMVAFAWAGFGASFGPIIILSLYWKRLTRTGALAGLISGAVMVFAWAKLLDGWLWQGLWGMPGSLYEIVPGFLLNLAVAVVVSHLTKAPDEAVLAEFDAAKAAAS